MILRQLAYAIAAIVLLPFAAAHAQQTEIVVYHYQTDTRYQALKEVIRRFEAENKDIKVTDIFKPDTTITADVQAALAARRPVDIATIAGRNVYFMSQTTPAVAINQDPAKATFLDNYLPQFLDVGRHGDKVFAVPYAFGTPMLYYNKDVFRKAGLDPDVPPKTWEELIAAAKTIQDKTGVAGVAHLTAGNKDYGTMLMVTNAGGTYLNPEGNKLLFDGPEGIAGLQLWQDLVVKHKVMPLATDAQWIAAFFGGRLAMYITSSAGLRQAVQASQGRFDLGVANYPLFPGRDVRRVPNSGATFMLYAPEGPRREASLKFLAFISRLEIANYWSREVRLHAAAQGSAARSRDEEIRRRVSVCPAGAGADAGYHFDLCVGRQGRARSPEHRLKTDRRSVGRQGHGVRAGADRREAGQRRACRDELIRRWLTRYFLSPLSPLWGGDIRSACRRCGPGSTSRRFSWCSASSPSGHCCRSWC